LGKTIVPCGNVVEDAPGSSRGRPDFAGFCRQKAFLRQWKACRRNLAKKSAVRVGFFPDLS